eukprot:6795964-Prymnesium_polylepis.1
MLRDSSRHHVLRFRQIVVACPVLTDPLHHVADECNVCRVCRLHSIRKDASVRRERGEHHILARCDQPCDTFQQPDVKVPATASSSAIVSEH